MLFADKSVVNMPEGVEHTICCILLAALAWLFWRNGERAWRRLEGRDRKTAKRLRRRRKAARPPRQTRK